MGNWVENWDALGCNWKGLDTTGWIGCGCEITAAVMGTS